VIDLNGLYGLNGLKGNPILIPMEPPYYLNGNFGIIFEATLAPSASVTSLSTFCLS
jgi:hypothetical protein